MKRWSLSASVRLWFLVSLSGCLSAMPAAFAERLEESEAIAVQPGWAKDEPLSLQQKNNTSIPQLGDIELPATSAKLLVQQPAPTNPKPEEVIAITGVKANPTDKGVEVILETTTGDKLQVANRSTGNNFIADITGGQLRLHDGNAFTFKSEKPIEGITEITVTNIDANTMRVTVVGEKALPAVELFDDDMGLIFAVASTATTAQEPEKPPEEKPEEQPAAQQDDPIELVVTGERDSYRVPNASTATRTDTPLRDIPQSIQVVPQEVLRDQNVTNTNEALQNVPGVASFLNSRTERANFTIRGFNTNPSDVGNYLRNGLRENGGTLSDLTPDIERIEVLKGPASVLYGQATPGGTINFVIPSMPLMQLLAAMISIEVLLIYRDR